MTNYNPFSLEGKRILVTGATSGIGRASAIECAKLGAHIIAIGRNESRMATLKQEIGQSHEFYGLELTDLDAVSAFTKNIESIDGLLNCAGIGTTVLFQSVTPAKMQNIFNVNFFAPVELTRLLVKGKKINKGGSIVFVSSIDGPINSHIANSSYSATKAALTGIAKGMAVELAAKQIRVNYLMPGQTETPLIHNDSITDEQLLVDMQKYPMKRYGRPEEIAYGAIYFLSDASSFTTGSGLVIDGGFTLV